MAGIPGKTLFLAICLLGTYCHVLGGFNRKPPTTDKKHGYTVELEKIDMIGTPREYLSPDTVFFTRFYNDTTRVASADIYVVKDLSENTMVTSTLFRLDNNNRWVQYSQRLKRYCDYMREYIFISESIYENGNLTRECPIRKGNYYFRNFLVDTTEFPFELEELRWRMTYDLFTKDKGTFLKFDVIAWSRPIDDGDAD